MHLRERAVADQITDPFAAHDGWLARGAARLGCTEGQVYTMLIGLLLTSAVWSNALPNVVWRQTSAPPARSASVAPSPTAQPAPIVVPSGPTLAPLPLPVPTPLPGSVTPGPVATEPAFPFPSFSDEPTSSGATEVLSGGWASAYAGTPLSTFGVPDGDVVTSARGTQPENVAYLKLTGDATPLVLKVDAAGTNVLDSIAVLRLCAVTTPTWKVGRGDVALDQAPATDCKRGIDGVRSADGGSWTFDVAAVDLTGTSGVAITPVASNTAPQFQVVFQLPHPAASTSTAPTNRSIS